MSWLELLEMMGSTGNSKTIAICAATVKLSGATLQTKEGSE